MKINFFSSIHNSSDQYLTWIDYSKNIYNISHNDVVFQGTKTIKDIDHIDINSKKTFRISDIINYATKISDDDVFVILNSDIEISIENNLWKKLVDFGSKGLVFANRYNYDRSYEDGSINLNGIDFFIIPKKLIVPHDDFFSFGVCGWDWWIPFLARQQNLHIYTTKTPFAFHKKHEKRWNNYQLEKSINYFLKITGEQSNIEFKKSIIQHAKYI